MKISHIVLNLDCGGLEHLVIQLAKHQAASGIAAEIICLAQKGALAPVAESYGIKVHALDKCRGKDFGLVFRLFLLLKETKPDIVHTHNFAPLIYGTPAARLAGIRCINTRHGREAKKAPWSIWALNNKLIAVSQDAKNAMCKVNRLNPKKVEVVYNGIDMGRYKTISKTDLDLLKKELKIPLNRFIVGTVGRLSPEKDQATLIKAFRKCIEREMNVTLVIVGDGPLRKDLEVLVSRYGLEAHVLFLGYRDDVAQIMSAFDVFVLSSFMEGVPLTMLEAMAAGKPVIATKVGGHPEVVVEEETGFLVPCGFPERITTAIERLMLKPELAKEMGLAGQKRVYELFGLDKMATAYEEIYKKLEKSGQC